jgi:hypothetical protein
VVLANILARSSSTLDGDLEPVLPGGALVLRYLAEQSAGLKPPWQTRPAIKRTPPIRRLGGAAGAPVYARSTLHFCTSPAFICFICIAFQPSLQAMRMLVIFKRPVISQFFSQLNKIDICMNKPLCASILPSPASGRNLAC